MFFRFTPNWLSEGATSPSQPATLTWADVASSYWPAWLARPTLCPIGCQNSPLLSKQLSHPDGYVGLIQRVCITFNPVCRVTSLAMPASFSCTCLTVTHLSFISRRLDLPSSSAKAAGLTLTHELLSPRQKKKKTHVYFIDSLTDCSEVTDSAENLCYLTFFSPRDVRSGERWLSEGAQRGSGRQWKVGEESRYPRQHMFESER